MKEKVSYVKLLAGCFFTAFLSIVSASIVSADGKEDVVSGKADIIQDKSDAVPGKVSGFDEKKMEKWVFECEEGKSSYVYYKETKNPQAAKYIIHQGKDQSVYYAKLSVKGDAVHTLKVMDSDGKKIQSITWNSFVPYYYVGFEDLNKDGYLDLMVAVEETPRNVIHEFYVWNPEKQKYHKVKYLNAGEMDAFADFVCKDGYVMNWIDSVLQVFVWRGEDLYRVYENYCIPNGEENVVTYKNKKHTAVSYDDLKFKVPLQYYIVSKGDDGFYKHYVCKSKKNSKAELDLWVSKAYIVDITTFQELKDYYLCMEDTFQFASYEGYSNLSDSSGVKAIYKAIGKDTTFYYVITDKGAYEVTANDSYLEDVMLNENHEPDLTGEDD